MTLQASVRAFAAILLLSVDAFAVEPRIKSIEPPQRILFVGNSFTYYNNSLHNHLGNLLRAAGEYRTGKTSLRAMTISGSRLSEHAGGIVTVVQPSRWDLVMMQGHSTELMEKDTADSFLETATKFSKAIRAKGAEPAFLMTWAYRDRPKMIETISERYIEIANRLDALVAPVGLAFQRAMQDYSHIDLYSKDVRRFEKDDKGNVKIIYRDAVKHPSEAGTYLAACVLYASLFQRSPVGSAYRGSLGEEDAEILQQVAVETVNEFYRRTN